MLNPNLALLFKGVNFRVFRLSFLFHPRSEAELLEALAIIKVFKYWSAPYYEANKTLIIDEALIPEANKPGLTLHALPSE